MFKDNLLVQNQSKIIAKASEEACSKSFNDESEYSLAGLLLFQVK